MGRLTAGGVHRIELKGESLRRKNQKLTYLSSTSSQPLLKWYISNRYKRYIYPAIGINETVGHNLWHA